MWCLIDIEFILYINMNKICKSYMENQEGKQKKKVEKERTSNMRIYMHIYLFWYMRIYFNTQYHHPHHLRNARTVLKKLRKISADGNMKIFITIIIIKISHFFLFHSFVHFHSLSAPLMQSAMQQISRCRSDQFVVHGSCMANGNTAYHILYYI